MGWKGHFSRCYETYVAWIDVGLVRCMKSVDLDGAKLS